MPPAAPRFLVLGAGAIGTVFAARLAARHPVAVIARGSRLEAIRRRGLAVTGATETRIRPAASAASAGDLAGFRPDFVLVAVKTYGTEAAARDLRPLGAAPVRVSLQNGLGNEEVLAAGGYPVIGAVLTGGATLRGSGEVFHAGVGEVIASACSGTEEAAVDRLGQCLRDAGFPVRAVPDIGPPLWRKVILNAAVNPVSALLGLRTGQLLDDPGTIRLLRSLVGEAAAVATAAGFPCAEEEIWKTLRQIVVRTADNRSSMLQDLERGARTEIEAITGAVVARGARLGVPTPWNRLMLRLVRAREHGSGVATGG